MKTVTNNLFPRIIYYKDTLAQAKLDRKHAPRAKKPVDPTISTRRESLAQHNMVIKTNRSDFLRRRQEFIRLNWTSIRRFVDSQCPGVSDLSDQSTFEALTEQPSFLRGVVMRDYQLKGLNWLISSYQNGINVILGGNCLFHFLFLFN